MNNGKGVHIAKQFVLGKIERQNQVLRKYGLRQHDFTVVEKVDYLKADDLSKLRARLMAYEGHCFDRYFSQIFRLIRESLRPECRKTFKAYDGVNNIFNLVYEILSWKAHYALIKAKLEPCLGFLYSTAKGKPSLICDFQELYSYLVDDFVIQYRRKLRKHNFTIKDENFSTRRKGKREYLNDSLTHSLVNSLNEYFKTKVEIQRIRMGKSQEIETLINEEALLLAQYVRNERQLWYPRTAGLT